MLVRFEEQYLPNRIFETNAESLDDANRKAMGHFKVNLNKLLDKKFYKVTILEN